MERQIFTLRPTVSIREALLDKPRQLVSYDVLSSWRLRRIARWLSASAEPMHVAGNFGYRRQRSPAKAVQYLDAYLRRYRLRVPVKQQRGLFVFRSDVAHYTDQISVHAQSPLWAVLRDFFVEAAVSRVRRFLLLATLRRLLRPRIAKSSPLQIRYPGLPTGVSVTTALANIFLLPLDRLLSDVQDGIYLRYGDDLLFAHPSLVVFEESLAAMQTQLNKLNLKLNDKKTQITYWTGCGRPCGEDAAGRLPMVASHKVSFVGYDLYFNGGAAIKADHLRRARREIRARLRRTIRLIKNQPIGTKVGTLTRVVNSCFARQSVWGEEFADIYVKTSHRGTLKDLDRWLAKTILRTISHKKTTQLSAQWPLRRLRSEFALVSLVRRKNG